VDQHVVAAEARQLELDEVRLGRFHDVGERGPRAVEESGLFEPLPRQRLVEEPVHALLQVQKLVQRIPA
jgi:hypothetical protein